ncbi:MAG TPA: ABC transporter permease [Gemmatimonadaceae bacterium]|nr:ABC transporter permease [Gemmatimonadaceae bacterium]
MTFLADLRYAVRVLLKKPGFTAIAVTTLALGIGLNTAVFSAIEALTLRHLPGVRDDARLVQVYRTYPGGFNYGSNSVPHYRDLRERSADVFSGVSAWTYVPLAVSSGGQTQRMMGAVASANFFSVLGASAQLGRTFVSAEDSTPGGSPVTVVSYGTWQTFFGGDPAIVGRTITLNGHRYTIVGVMPAEFKGPVPMVPPTFYVPLMQLGQLGPDGRAQLEQRGSNFMRALARLRDGVTIDQAQARMKSVVATMREEHPREYEGSGVLLVGQTDAGLHPQFRAAQVGLSSVVMAVVVMLLLIACVNVANLFLARAGDRAREMAVRLSLGAQRRQLVRQLLTESLVFAVVSGAAGLMLAWWTIGLANRIRLPIDFAFDPDLRLSVPVLLFTLGLSLVTGILFGLAPALQSTKPALVPALKGASATGVSRSRATRALVVAQMALSIILLVSAGLFLRNVRAAVSIDKGFDSENLLLASLDPGVQGYDRARTVELYRRLEERLRALPNVKAVAFAAMVPLGLSDQQTGVSIPGYTPSANENLSIDYNVITPGYFEAMGIPLMSGRGIVATDDSAAAGAVVVNQQFARRFFGGANPVGRAVRASGRDFTVVGLVRDGKYRSLGEPPRAYIYFPQTQRWDAAMTMHIKTTGDPTALGPVVRAEVAALDADLPVSDIRTMTSHLGISLLPARIGGITLGIFGGLGLLLAAVGMYGVMSYSVSQRRREIGIRVAIGAARGQVLGLVMRQGLRLVGFGTVIGLVGAVLGSRLVRGLLYGDAGIDYATLAGVPLVLIAVAAFAIWFPARRAATVDPMVALRGE